MWNKGKLVVIVPETAHGAEAEFERELAQLFAARLNAKLETIPMPPDKVRPSLRKHKAHLAAASLRSEAGIAEYISVPATRVCASWWYATATANLQKLAGLAEMKLAVVAGSSQEVALLEAQGKLPELQWQVRDKVTVQDLLAEVSRWWFGLRGNQRVTVADARNYHPNLVATLILPSLPNSHGDSPTMLIRICSNRYNFFSLTYNGMARYAACWIATMVTASGLRQWTLPRSSSAAVPCCHATGTCSRRHLHLPVRTGNCWQHCLIRNRNGILSQPLPPTCAA